MAAESPSRELSKLAIALVILELRRQLEVLDARARADDREYGAIRCYWPPELLEADIRRRIEEREGGVIG